MLRVRKYVLLIHHIHGGGDDGGNGGSVDGLCGGSDNRA